MSPVQSHQLACTTAWVMQLSNTAGSAAFRGAPLTGSLSLSRMVLRVNARLELEQTRSIKHNRLHKLH